MFGEDEWYQTMKNALYMDGLVTKHSVIMDKYDPDKKVALVVDDWGTWYDVEPGTNPGFLYQQNTLRDALVAGLTLNIFNNHCDRVKMANLAQTVNVLQAMVLTQNEKMIMTPTYHVFDLYKVHQDAELLDVYVDSPVCECGDVRIPQLSASTSIDSEGTVHISLCNLDLAEPLEIECELRGMDASSVSGSIITAAEMNAHNTFESPEVVRPAEFGRASVRNGVLTAALPPKSVVVLAVK